MTSLTNEESVKSQKVWPFDDTNNVNTNAFEGDDTQNGTATTSVRRRTRATADQLSVLEETFSVNVSPNSKLRKQLAEQLNMTERSIQIWFQNRRAKVKHIQKKAQMQIHQASIRAQLYQYQQQQQHLLQPYQQPYHYHNPDHLVNFARSHSVDSLHNHNHIQHNNGIHHLNPSTPISYSSTPPPISFGGQQSLPATPLDPLRITSKSMPPQTYSHHLDSIDPSSLTSLKSSEHNLPPYTVQQRSKSTVPELISVPDAGPTAMLVTNSLYYPTPSPNISYSQTSSTDLSTVSTIDPSSLMIKNSENKHTHNENYEGKEKACSKADSLITEPSISKIERNNYPPHHYPDETEEPKDLYLSTTTLTIGSWHRVKTQETDLVCVYRPDTRVFAWHIVDGGYHFKMEVAQNAVSSIEFILDGQETLADIHFDISEPPLFFMESTTSTMSNLTPDKKNKKKSSYNSTEEKETLESITPIWVQCSDFTEGKQASRLFRHTLRGVSHLIKQELVTLISNHEETRRLVHFIDTRLPYSNGLLPMYQPMADHMFYLAHPHTQFQTYNQQHPTLDKNNEKQLVQVAQGQWLNESLPSEILYMN